MFTCWENPIESIIDWNAIVRLLFSLSMWFITKVDRTLGGVPLWMCKMKYKDFKLFDLKFRSWGNT